MRLRGAVMWISLVLAGLVSAAFCAPAVAAPHVRYVSQWGGSGSGDAQFNEPTAIAVDKAGNVYVADRGNGVIKKFTPNGVFLTKFGVGLQQPYGLTVAADGTVYVTDLNAHRVQRYSADGILIATWGQRGAGDGQFFTPTGIATDAAGNVYVADTNNYRIQVFSETGTFLRKWGGIGTGPGVFDGAWGIALDAAGDVYVADKNNSRVQKFTSDGALRAIIGNSRYLVQNFGVDVGPNGHVYVADSFGSRIQEFHSSGVFLGTVADRGSGPGQVSSPFDVAVDGSGNLYVADYWNNRIQKFAPVVPPPPLPPPPIEHVKVDGDDGATDSDGCGGGPGTAADPCDTIQAGVDAVKDGGTVEVAAATDLYHESVNVYKPGVTIKGPQVGVPGYQGRGPPEVSIEATVVGSDDPALYLTAPDIRIDGLFITNSRPGIEVGTAVGGAERADIRNTVFAQNRTSIYVPSDDAVISRNSFHAGFSSFIEEGAISNRGSNNLTIRDNVFGAHDRVPAVNIEEGFGSTGVVIEGNTTRGNEGFAVRRVKHARITQNVVRDLAGDLTPPEDGLAVAGILLDNVEDVEVTGNSIENARKGIQLGRLGVGRDPEPIRDVLIEGNDLARNVVAGLEATHRARIDGVTMRANRIVGNAAGIAGTAAPGTTGPVFDAQNNWWGCNGGPGTPGCDTASAIADTSPHLVLSVAAMPEETTAPGTADIRADLRRNDAGDLVAEATRLPPTLVRFAKLSGPGALDPLQARTSEGVATTVLSSELEGTASVQASADSATASASVNFARLNSAPVCTGVAASPQVLWPPRGDFRQVVLSGATDPDGDPVALVISGVAHDDSGQSAKDVWLGVRPDAVWLRAARTGGGGGRTYTIRFGVSDSRGASCTGTASVRVPHSRGRKHSA